MLDVVFVVETGGRMYRLLEDAADFITSFTRIMKSALPIPDVRIGLLTFSSGERIQRYDLSDSAQSAARALLSVRGTPPPARLSLEEIVLQLANTFSWRRESRRYAIFYMNGQPEAVPYATDRLVAAKIRPITIPADGASTETHAILQSMARRGGGQGIIPDYLVRYSSESAVRRAFYLYKRVLYRLAHDVPESNWYDIYEAPRALASDRVFRAGSIDESFGIIRRSEQTEFRILEIKSRLARACAELISGQEGFAIAVPDTLLRFAHAGRTHLLPAASLRLPGFAAAWLGFVPIFESTHEDGFFPHPATLVFLPANRPPPVRLQQSRRRIGANAAAFAGSTERVFIKLDSFTLTPIEKKRFILE